MENNENITTATAEAETPAMKTLDVTVFCQAVYNSYIQVPANLSLDEAIEYAKAHLKDIPLGVLEWTPDSDYLDEENCSFAE